MAQASLGTTQQTVDPAPGPAVELLASTALTTDPSGAVSGIVSIAPFAEVNLFVKADVGAAGAYVHIAVMVSSAAAQPALGDDSWFALPEREAAGTATLVAGTLPTGADYTIAPEWSVVKVRPMLIRTEDGDANTDKIRMAVPLRVRGYRWMYVFAEEVVGNMTLAIDWNGNR